jgi:hypothetical protein
MADPTTYEQIYDKFLIKITDYELASLIDADLLKQLDRFLRNAIPDFLYCKQDLSKRNDATGTFEITLSESEQSILSKFMVVQWINPQFLRLENIRNGVGNRDFQQFSPGNLIDKLSKLKKDLITEACEDMVFYHFNVTE